MFVTQNNTQLESRIILLQAYYFLILLEESLRKISSCNRNKHSLRGVLRAGDTNRDICAGPKIQPLDITYYHIKFNRGKKKQTQRMVDRIGTLLLSFDRRLMENIKTSVCSVLNSSWTDVFIFCIKHLSNNNKRVPIWLTVHWVCFFFFQDWILCDNTWYPTVEFLVPRECRKCLTLYHLCAEYLRECIHKKPFQHQHRSQNINQWLIFHSLFAFFSCNHYIICNQLFHIWFWLIVIVIFLQHRAWTSDLYFLIFYHTNPASSTSK